MEVNMNISMIGSQIQKFRKQQGITQKELGTAIGVSTQAVSQWECGGTPDVSLLPAIADKLGVTIDTLFGREGGEAQDMTEAMTAWLRSQPRDKRLEILTQLIWHLTLFSVHPLDIPKMDRLKSCEQDLGDGKKLFMKSFFATDNGYIFGINAEDMSFMSVFPEPEEGYEQFFLENEVYRKLFLVLSMPGTLELLRFLSREKESFYIASAAAKHVGLTVNETATIFEKLADIRILEKIELNMGDGITHAYILPNSGDIIPLLYFARWICNNDNAYFMNIPRKRPSLAKKENYKNEKK